MTAALGESAQCPAWQDDQERCPSGSQRELLLTPASQGEAASFPGP